MKQNNVNNDRGCDPDITGVHVDGFPLPSIPSCEDDDRIFSSMRDVPLASVDKPMECGYITTDRPLRVIIAGGGLGGLALASDLMQRSMMAGDTKNLIDVRVCERARRYRPFGGPIQIQSNALWALQEINPLLYWAVSECGVRTGDRLSGIKDGKRYREGWLVKFDAATPARRGGLPLTLAINRVALQEIFLKYGVPRERVFTGNGVVGYETQPDNNVHGGGGVEVHLEDGSMVYGDVLVGADGIWSTVRHRMFDLPLDEVGPDYATKHACYSGYTCYTGTCRHTPEDIDEVAYKVFLGQEQYLGCTDAGHGWQHWWAFLPDPPGLGKNGVVADRDGKAMLDRLRVEFDGWSPEIHDLFRVTNPDVVRRRDLFDRPLRGWTKGCVTLMGDAAHPTMPNLGQGGAMAIEDAYVLGEKIASIRHTDEIHLKLQEYEKRRILRTSIAQFLSRNGSDLLGGWETMRTTPILGPISLWIINVLQPLTMDYLYRARI